MVRNKCIRIYFTLLFSLDLLFFSCATKSSEYKEIDNAVQKDNYEEGIEVIRKGQGRKRPRYSEKNAVSLFLDKGLLEHYAGNYAASSNDLQEAERLIGEAYTKSITADVFSYIANDNTKEYPGEDFEDIYLNIFNALNYYNAGKIDGALVEIRKLTWTSGKLDMLGRKYEDADAKATGGSMAEFGKLGFTSFPDLPQRKSVKFSDSALARYLGALFYLSEGNTSSANIEFGRIPAAFASNPNVYTNPVPKSVADAQNVPNGKARLNVIGFTGLSPVKEEQVFNQIFPFFQNVALMYPQFKLPVLVKRPSTIDRIEVVIGNEKCNLELLEDMGAVIEETYNARFSGIFLKTYIRTLLKYAAIDIAATEARKQAEANLEARRRAEAEAGIKTDQLTEQSRTEFTIFLAVASALAVKKVFDATESADIRMSRYLPDKAYIGGINLDPGTYQVEVQYYSGGRLVEKKAYNDVAVRENGLNLIETIKLR